MTKTMNYENMPITAGELAHRIVNYLQARKYEVAYSYDETKKSWCLIHARKTGKLRTATGNRRALSIALTTKSSKQCRIAIGTGEWGKNTFISAIPMIVFPVLGFMNFVGSATSSKASESELWLYIESIANKDFYKNR
ncbi:MAG: hypothetical protein ACREAK_11785 [Nitrosarchaeum sp.]